MTKFGNVALTLLGTACVWASTKYPRASLLAVSGLCLGAPALTGSFAALELVVVFVLYQATISSDLDLRVLALVGLGALWANEAWRRTTVSEPLMGAATLYPFVLTAFAIGLGWQGRQLRRANRQLVDLRDADRALARLDERRMIARDLHDVAAHHLSALVVRNKLARRVGTDEALRAASDFTATTATEALDALRQVVGVLRDRPLDNDAPVTRNQRCRTSTESSPDWKARDFASIEMLTPGPRHCVATSSWPSCASPKRHSPTSFATEVRATHGSVFLPTPTMSCSPWMMTELHRQHRRC
jgi:signal transduction histidine kinase